MTTIHQDTRVSPLTQKLEQSVATIEQTPARKDRQPTQPNLATDAAKIVKIIKPYPLAQREALLSFVAAALAAEG